VPRNVRRSEEEAGSGPNVHLDIQIHIPADASVEQIDQIFESMARHLYKQ
jgi:glycine cleavage system regulatory protein